MLRPNKPKTSNGPMKVLNAPVHLGSMVENTDSTIDDIKSIWVVQRDDTLVYKKRLDNLHSLISNCFIES